MAIHGKYSTLPETKLVFQLSILKGELLVSGPGRLFCIPYIHVKSSTSNLLPAEFSGNKFNNSHRLWNHDI